MRTWVDIREDFPILKEQISGRPLIYLDNAATTQLPKAVLDRWAEHYTKHNANVHRGIHTLSERSTAHMEAVREKVLELLHAEGLGQVIFTSGATDAANLVASSFLRHRLRPGDAVLSTELEHHSNYVVWQQICLECGACFRVIPTVDGELDMEAAERMLRDNVRLLAVTAVSNVLGTVTDIRTLTGLAHRRHIPVYVDAAQAMRHIGFDLAELDCDFLGFSAHKMMGPTGVGCLFVHQRYQEEMRPYRYGGGMVELVREERTTFSGLPAFGAALDYLREIGWERIYAREDELTQTAQRLLLELKAVTVLGKPKRRAGVLSITVDGVHPYDLASFLDKYGVAVRTGSMCAQPAVNHYGLQTVTRISPAFYNTPQELDRMAEYMETVIRFLRKR